MATNVFPKFTSAEWTNDGVTVNSISDYSLEYYTDNAWVGFKMDFPSEWKGQKLTIGCSSITGAVICILNDMHYYLGTNLTSGGEVVYEPSVTEQASMLFVYTETEYTNAIINDVYAYIEEPEVQCVQNLYIGENKINGLFLGDLKIAKVYVGDVLCYGENDSIV